MKPISFSTLLLLLLSFAVNSQTLPPKAEMRETKDIYFGFTVTDNYRWLENLASEDTQKWMKAQSAYALAYLDQIKIREEYIKELTALTNNGVRVSGIQKRGNLYFYYRRAPNENDSRIYVRDGLHGTERLLLSPENIVNDGKRRSIDVFRLSIDGKYLSYISSIGGSETGELRIIETATGKDTGEVIDRARHSAGRWLPDGRSFLYTRLKEYPPNTPETELFKKRTVYLHILGTKPESDKPIFGYGVNPNIEDDGELIPAGYFLPNSKYVFASLNSGVSPNSKYYFAPLESVIKNPSGEISWKQIADLDDEVSNFYAKGDEVYFLTYKKAPRYKVVRVNLAKPNLAKAELVFSGGEAIVETFAAAKDALYVQTRDGGVKKIYRVDYKTKKAVPIKLPYEGSATIATFDSAEDGIEFDLVSWTKSNARFAYNPKTATAIDTKLIPPNNVDMSQYDFTYKKAKSHDGVMIPMVLIYKKGIKLNGKNPVFLYGYGAYGTESISVAFIPRFKPWLERGGIYVITGVRGGGEYGEEWHLAGKGKTKPNTWKDFIACAEYLIQQKYTSPQYIGAYSGSAGGILINNAITERPDLFGAVVNDAGESNILLSELTTNGVPNIPEFGSHKTEEGFKNLLAMDGYLKVKDGVKYPPVLFTHGMNDSRVPPWTSAKMAARLQAATASNKPILLKLDYDDGHGFGSSVKQDIEFRANMFAFFSQQLMPDKR